MLQCPCMRSFSTIIEVYDLLCLQQPKSLQINLPLTEMKKLTGEQNTLQDSLGYFENGIDQRSEWQT